MSEQVDGFYTAYLTGKVAQGLAMLVFRSGQIVGADFSGVLFDGKYHVEADGLVSISLFVKTPPNVNLIQGGVSGPDGLKTELEFKLPSDFSSRPFVRVEGPRGPINARLVKLRGLDD